MSWIELKLNVPYESLEQISGYLFALGCEGINVTDKEIYIYFTEHYWTDEIKLGLVECIRNFIPHFSLRHLQISALADQDWNINWKDSFRSLRITSRITVAPPWEKPNIQEGGMVITINPKMAFGTGHHESTQLAIIALEKWLKEGMQVLDIGTGSGILAITAKKLGAESVLAIDNDPLAINNAEENTRLNKLSGKVKFFVAELEYVYRQEYDLICANINLNVLLNYANLLTSFLNEGGILILSGILLSDELRLLNIYYQNGFQLLGRNARKSWLCLVLQLKTKEKDSTGFTG
jgi:ribosomal protein L11 methyltransferase